MDKPAPTSHVPAAYLRYLSPEASEQYFVEREQRVVESHERKRQSALVRGVRPRVGAKFAGFTVLRNQLKDRPHAIELGCSHDHWWVASLHDDVVICPYCKAKGARNDGSLPSNLL